MRKYDIPGFEMIEELGTGGMGSVWKARQVSLDRIVAIKFLSSGLSRDSECIERFRKEAQAAAKLKHPGIVQVYDAHAEHGLYYFVMEFVAGYTVGEWVRRKGRLPEKDALLVAECVADALRYAWETANIIHCDIKPDNVMVDADGTVKLADLGLARTLTAIGGGRSGDEVFGTPQYISPEQAMAEADLDFRSDIYSLGAMMYHLVTGRMPFQGEPPEVIMEKQVSDTLPDPVEINPELSNGICWLIEKMMAKDRERRENDWSVVRDDIRRVKKRLRPAGEPLPEGASTVRRHSRRLLPDTAPAGGRRSASAPRRRARIWPRLAAIALLVLAVLIYVQIRKGTIRLRKLPAGPQGTGRPSPAGRATPPEAAVQPTAPSGEEEAARAVYDEAMRWISDNPQKYDEIIATLSAVMEKTGGTRYTTMAEVQLRRYKLARFNEVQAVMNELRRETAGIVEAGRFTEAAERYDRYEGRLAAETASDRAAAAAQLRQRQARAAEAERRRLQVAERRTLELMQAAAGQVLEGSLDKAIEEIDGALREPSAYADVDRLKSARELLAQAGMIEARVLRSFADQVGSEITVRFQGGSIDLTVEKVEGDTVYCTRKRVVGSAVASSALNFKVSDLAPAERLNRMGDAERQPEVALMKGLMAYEAGAESHARKYFGMLDPFLGGPLVNRMDAKKGSDEHHPPEEASAPPPEEAEPARPEPAQAGQGKVSDLARREYGAAVGDGDAVVKLLCERNNGLRRGDIIITRSGVGQGGRRLVAGLTITSPLAADLGPVAALPDLKFFQYRPAGSRDGGALRDLRPLAGLSLDAVVVENCRLQDLLPLKGMPLKQASFAGTNVRDLTPLRGMALVSLDVSGTRVIDISPLAGMPLNMLNLNDLFVRNFSYLAGMPLKRLELKGGKFSSVSFLAGLELQELNLAETMVRELGPLKGMPLEKLSLAGTPVTDITPLESLPIKDLDLGGTSVKDFSTVRNLPLRVLKLADSSIGDLWVLKDMRLHALNISKTGVKALWPLKGMPLEHLNIEFTKVADLSVLAGLPLKSLSCRGIPATDFGPLRGLPIEALSIDSPKAKPWLKTMLPKLRSANGIKVEKLW